MRSADRPERAHYGLAVYCAKRFFGRGVPREELIGEAEAALLWAAARFDARRGVRFSTYAIPFVLGALRELCRRAGPMHVPRAEARILTAVESARGKLNAREGREPTVRELAQAVGVEPGLLGEMLAARDRMRRADGALDVQTASAPGEGFEDWVLLKDTLTRLPSPYAQVLWLRFGQGWSQARLAERFGVGQPQISRWERKGKELLRQALDFDPSC
ncbi:MAG: sigma-70 family RNA polymerase sigma factor [Christensenellales bacterium]